MSDKNDGGQAFPIPDAFYPNGDVQPGCNGMTLRDYFAAKAMQSILVNLKEGIRPQDMIEMAEDSYMLAEAMLKAREVIP